jgi:hypothetical protein
MKIELPIKSPGEQLIAVILAFHRDGGHAGARIPLPANPPNLDTQRLTQAAFDEMSAEFYRSRKSLGIHVVAGHIAPTVDAAFGSFVDTSGNGTQTLSVGGEPLYGQSIIDGIAGLWLDYQFFQRQAAKLMEKRAAQESELDRMIREAKDHS